LKLNPICIFPFVTIFCKDQNSWNLGYGGNEKIEESYKLQCIRTKGGKNGRVNFSLKYGKFYEPDLSVSNLKNKFFGYLNNLLKSSKFESKMEPSNDNITESDTVQFSEDEDEDTWSQVFGGTNSNNDTVSSGILHEYHKSTGDLSADEDGDVEGDQELLS